MKNESLFGLHAVLAVLTNTPERILEVLILQGREDQRMQDIIMAAKAQGIPVSQKPRKTLDNLANGNHQGVVAIAKPSKALVEEDLYALIDNLGNTPAFILVLDGVTDPHNLGACLRSADAAGVHAVVVPKDNSALLTENVRKVGCLRRRRYSALNCRNKPGPHLTKNARTRRVVSGHRRRSHPKHLPSLTHRPYCHYYGRRRHRHAPPHPRNLRPPRLYSHGR